MATSWSELAVAALTDATVCPRCGAALVRVGVCDTCGADLDSPRALGLWHESERLAERIREWRSLADRLPTRDVAAEVPPAVLPPTPQGAQPAVSPVAPSVEPSVEPSAAPYIAPAQAAGSHVSQQSVLAIAGAALVAIAAVVFAFLNPDLTDVGTRTGIIAAVTALFLGGSWLLARQGLRFSAETIGALGLVFVGLDVWAVAGIDPRNAVLLAAVALLVAAAALFALARVSGVGVWLWGSLAAVVAAPALFGYAGGSPWAAVAGHVGVAAVSLGALEALARLSADRTGLRVTATVAQLAAFAVVPAQVVALLAPGDRGSVVAGAAALLALSAVAALTTRRAYAAPWSFVAGSYAAASVGVVTFSVDADSSVWLVALLPAAASVALVAIAAATWRRPLGTVSTAALRTGAWSVAFAAAFPAGMVTVLRFSVPSDGVFSDETSLAASLGLAAVAAGSGVLARLTPDRAARRRALAVALWFAAVAVASFTLWTAFLPVTRLTLALVVASAIAVAVRRLRSVAGAPTMLRVPVVAVAHGLVVVTAAMSWSTDLLGVSGGVAIVVVVLVLAWAVPVVPRTVYTGAAFAYGLVVVAAAVGLSDLPTIAVLSLTSAVGSACALAATLVRRVSTPVWYGLLAVTAVPFVVAVGVVLLERSGWSAVSTGTTFALALVLVLSRREGLTWVLRTVAAGLLVPSLAVVVVCLSAQLFVTSGSPIALPAIAAIVAVVLPSTDLARRALEARGVPRVDARRARLAIEATALVTAAIATLLAVVRVAAGLETTLVVLLIVGAGGAATAVFARRRYGWVIAAAAWTGALWSGYGLLGVGLLEAYVLPPALAAAAIGAVGVARGRGGARLFVVGLVAATAPTLVVFTLEGGAGRLVGLLVGACTLIVLSTAVALRPAASRLRPLVALTGPALLVAVGAAASGVLQAARFGSGLDRTPVPEEFGMLPALGLGVVAAAVAAVAAHRLSLATGSTSRWLYVPAAVYFALAPMTGIAHEWLAIATMWGVMAVLLAAMLVTARLARERAVALPPVWLLFVLAWLAGVVGWSERELRVEAFSIPLGLALLAAGVLAMRGPTAPGTAVAADLTTWPIGFSGSWRLLAPGLVVALAPSVLSTATDPLTVRAVLVIVLALAAILVGSKLRLAAPFVLGLVVLPIENVVVFSVQIGRSIGAAPWWITLATAGAVLLVLAVSSERRVSAGRGVAARLRDLR